MAKILLVDDSATIRSVIRKALEPASHMVMEAVDGADGLVKLGEFSPDIIMTDINMPNIDGLTFSQRVKENDSWKKIPIVVISTEASPEMKAKGKEIGVAAWMIKPPNPAKLLEAIEKLMAMQAAKG